MCGILSLLVVSTERNPKRSLPGWISPQAPLFYQVILTVPDSVQGDQQLEWPFLLITISLYA